MLLQLNLLIKKIIEYGELNNKGRKTMNDIYKCDCGQIVRSESQPEPISWTDGHVCILVKEDKDQEGALYIGDYK